MTVCIWRNPLSASNRPPARFLDDPKPRLSPDTRERCIASCSMANRPRCTPKCDFSPKRTDLKELSRTAGKTPRAEREKPQLTAASETFLPNGHSTTPPKSLESRQNPFRSVVYGEKIGFGARFGLDSNTREPLTREHRASVDKAPEGTMFPEARLQGLLGMREVPGAARGAQDCPGCARLPGGARPLVRTPISNAMRRHARASASSHRNRSPSPARCCRFDAPSSLYSAP